MFRTSGRLGHAVATALLAAGVLGAATGCGQTAAERNAPRISDTAFERAAGEACRAAVQVFNVAATLPKTPTDAQRADLLESIDATFTALVVRLKQVVAAPQDAAAVQAWLTDWDAYISFGHLYASALRVGAERDLVANRLKEQNALRDRLVAFAGVNHMGDCRFP